MPPLHADGRRLAEMFTKTGLEKIESQESVDAAAKELREAALDWIEYHTERRLATRATLETA